MTFWTAALALMLTASLGLGAMAEPVRPSDDRLALAQVPARQSPLNALRSDLAADPGNLALAVTFARAAIGEGRRNADPRFYGQAEAALSPWWNMNSAPAEVLVLRATIRQSFHQFKLALADLNAVIAADPNNAQAHLSRAFIHLTGGEPQAAQADCDALVALRLVHTICTARVKALTGHADEATTELNAALAEDRRANAGMKSFALAVLADIAVARGDSGTAERTYKQLIGAGGADAATLAAYADLLIAANRPQEALTLLDNAGEADIILLRRAIAAKQTGDARLATWTAVLAERFSAAASSGNRVHLREEARFFLEVKGDAKAALALAISNWTIQKEPADAALLLAAAKAAGDDQAAQTVLDHIEATELDDARLRVKKSAS